MSDISADVPQTVVAAPPPPAGVALEVGTLFGDYEVRANLGTGGMGDVYRVHNTADRRDEALKVVHDLSPAQVARFQGEVEIQRGLQHENIATIYGSGQLQDGRPFYTMELLVGEDMDKAIKDRGLSPQQAVEAVQQVAFALQYVHENDVVHRDVKPQNIFLCAANVRAVLLDFGLARKGPGPPAQPGSIVGLLGTPLYMAPEQIDHPGAVDKRADIYSLGAVLYHALAKKPPFVSSDQDALLDSVRYEEPASLRRMSGVDRNLESIVLACLAKDPASRYATAEDLGHDCGRWLSGEPVKMRPPGLPVRLWRRVRRHPRAALAMAAAALVALAPPLGVLLRYRALPQWRAAQAARAEVAARAQRVLAARALLSSSRVSLAAGQKEAADRQAAALIDRFSKAHEDGEPLPIPEAHRVRADAALRSGRLDEALTHAYRAYETAIGTVGAPGHLAAVADLLVQRGEVTPALGAYEEVIRDAGTADDLLALRARFGHARCLASLFRLEEARAAFEALPSVIPGVAQAELPMWRRLLTLLTPVKRMEVSTSRLAFRDLDADGRLEVLAISGDGRDVVVGRFTESGWHELARRRLLEGEPYGLSVIDAYDLDGDKVPEILVAGGHAERNTGRLFVLGWRSGALDVRCSTELASSVAGSPLGVADLDGDGRPELLLGTHTYEASLRIYQYTKEPPALRLREKVALGGEVTAVLIRDLDGDGRPEIWAFAGPWRAYSLVGLTSDPGSGQMHKRAALPLSTLMWIDPQALYEQSSVGGSRFIAATSWGPANLRQLRELHGRTRVEAQWPSTGVYQVHLQPNMTARVIPLVQVPWDDVWKTTHHDRTAGACSLAPDLVWTWTQPPDRSGRILDPRAALLARQDGTWKRFATFEVPTSAHLLPLAADLDGDGDLELVIPLGQGPSYGVNPAGACEVLGLGTWSGSSSREQAQPYRTAPHVLTRNAPRLLQAAQNAERMGLLPQALDAYRKAMRQQPLDEDGLRDAALGHLRVALRLGRMSEAAEVALKTIDACPVLTIPLSQAARDGLSATGEWHSAREFASRVTQAPGLPPDDVDRARTIQGQLARLDDPTRVLGLAEICGGSVSVHVTSPYAFRRTSMGSLEVHGMAGPSDLLLVPLSHDGDSYRIRLRIDPRRHDWGTAFFAGLLGGPLDRSPERGLPEWGAVHGGSSTSGRRIQAISWEAGGERFSPLLSHALYAGETYGQALGPYPSPSSLVLEYVGPMRTLQVRAPGVVGGAPSPSPPNSSWLVIGTRTSGPDVDSRLLFDVKELVLQAGRGGVLPTSRTPRQAIELLTAANGLAFQRKDEEALALYGKAMVLGDLETAQRGHVKDSGLPSPQDGLYTPWPRDLVRAVPVEARLWRALVLARQGRRGEAREDLSDALDRSPDRVYLRISASALALRDAPAETAVLADGLYAYATRTGAATDARSFAAWLGHHVGVDAANLLLAERDLRFARQTVLSTVEPPRPDAPLLAGDILLSFSGHHIDGLATLRRLQAEARDVEMPKATVVVLRNGKHLRCEIDPREVRIVASQRLVLESGQKGGDR